MYKSRILLNKNIRSQFLKMILKVSIIFLLIVILFFLYVKSSNQSLKEERDSISDKAELVDKLAASFNEVIFRARGYYAFQDKKELELLYQNLEKLEIYLSDFEQLSHTKEEEALYENLMNFYQNYQLEILPQAISFVEANDYVALRKLSSTGTNDIVNEFISYTNNYDKKTKLDLNEIFSETIKKAQTFTLISLLLGILLLFFVAVIMRRVLSNLIEPIEQLTKATEAITSGQSIDLTSLIEKQDELGILANSFLKMTMSIQEKEEILTTQNEELTAQQDELQGNQVQLQNSLNQLQKFNELNHVLTFTLDKQQLLENLNKYLNSIYKFDSSVLYLLDGNVYVSKGLSNESTQNLVGKLNKDKQVRLKEEKSFVIKRSIIPKAHDFAQQPYFCYDLYSSVLNSEGELVAVMIATREGYPFSEQEIQDLNGLMNRVSIAIERVLMYEVVERSRKLNQNIIDNVNEGIQLVSVTGDIVIVNQALTKIVPKIDNYHKHAISRQLWLNSFYSICDHPDDLIQFFNEAIVEEFSNKRTFRYSITNKSQIFIEVYATSVYEGEEKKGTMFVHRDITREYEVDQMKSELVSTVSHELRTPLSSVLGFTELLLTKELKPERQTKYIETIHKEAVRLTNLINDFLDLQRMESGKQKYSMQVVSMDELSIDIVNRFRHELNHHVHLIDSAKYVTVSGDSERLIQVFINIIGNAIKFSPNGGEVIITLENVNDMLQVSIKDYGIGIPTDEISKLFQKFKRIDNSSRRKIGGTGLGLAICKEIINEHGGDIWIESEEGQGTTVYFNIPITCKALTRESMDNKVLIDEQTGLNVMIIEDDLSLALLLSEELKSKGFTVIYHNNPKLAYEEALQTPLVGIVIDIMLGDDMNGWDLVKLLRENKQTSEIPIIISSALDESIENVEKYQVEKYFTKPYPPEELSKIILRHVIL